MRTTWIILSIMVVIGLGMFYLSTIKTPPGVYDSIAIDNTSDSVTKKIKIYAANNPAEVYYLDSIWLQADSTPLKKILDGNKLNFINKRYQSITLFLTYDDKVFYDLEIDKPDTTQAYEISFTVQPMQDTFFVQGTVDKHKGDLLRFRGPMIPLYKQFILSYNNKLPPPEPDTSETDSPAEPAEEPPGPPPNKTITVIEN